MGYHQTSNTPQVQNPKIIQPSTNKCQILLPNQALPHPSNPLHVRPSHPSSQISCGNNLSKGGVVALMCAAACHEVQTYRWLGIEQDY